METMGRSADAGIACDEIRKAPEGKVDCSCGSEWCAIPSSVRGMTTLDRTQFEVKIILPAVKCSLKSCSLLQSRLKKLLFRQYKLPTVVKDPDLLESHCRLLLLNPSIKHLSQLDIEDQELLVQEEAILTEREVSLNYDNFSASDVLKAVLPASDDEFASSFETIGHIAHFNLKKNLLAYKHLIGEVILDKNAHIRTVVNKTDSIDTAFRFFAMELLAGENMMQATVREHGCVFEFDFSKVYWNSRLQTEHKYIVDKTKAGSIVMDVFAGVGPFAIPLAKKSCTVFANDLNPESYKSLCHNIELNKVSGKAQAFNLDGRKFIKDVVIPRITSHTSSINGSEPSSNGISLILNLPALAPEFLDVFCEMYESPCLPLVYRKDIIVHCYCFSSSNDPRADAEVTIMKNIGQKLCGDVVTRVVRRVAPNKVMMCVSFNLMWPTTCTTERFDGINGRYIRKRPIEDGEVAVRADAESVESDSGGIFEGKVEDES